MPVGLHGDGLVLGLVLKGLEALGVIAADSQIIDTKNQARAQRHRDRRDGHPRQVRHGLRDRSGRQQAHHRLRGRGREAGAGQFCYGGGLGEQKPKGFRFNQSCYQDSR